ncbi:MAG: oxidoreductase [Ilumatobacteraceae bacterium]|nr:oxidoreductase [Ilumatobacteraceae bacterium]
MKRFAPTSETPSRRVAPDDAPLRLAVFGAGKAARFHLDALDHLAGVRFAGVCSRSGRSGEALAAGRPGVHTTTAVEDLIDPSRYDAALVAVSHDETAGIARRLIEAGIPVLIEKPAAPSAAEAAVLAELAADREVLALVAVNRRYYSLVQQALAVVRQRGPIRGVVVEGHEGVDDLMRAGALDAETAERWLQLNSLHFIDLLRLAGGEVEEVTGFRASANVASGDSFSASIRFAGGALGTYVAHWSSSAPPMLRVFGDEVTAEVRLAPPEDAFATFPGKRRMRLHADQADLDAKAGVLEQDAAFLLAVAAGRTSAPRPASTLADHVASLALVEAIAAL